MSRFAWMMLVPSAALLLAGCGSQNSGPREAKPPKIKVSLPVTDTLTDYEVFTGRTQALNAVDLRARVAAYLEFAPFKQGDDVKRGDILFVLQKKQFEQTLRQAKATRDQQKALMQYAESVYQRNNTLRSQNAVTVEEFQLTLSNRATSRATYEGSEAAVVLAEQNLEWCTVRAPFDGRISRRLVDPGNVVLADTTILASLVELDELYAYFDVDERTLLHINPLLPRGKVPVDAAKRLPLMLALANDKPEEFAHRGYLDIIDNRVDANSGTLRMWGKFENPKFDLKPGMFVRVRMGVGEPRKVLFVRESALGSNQGQKFLFVVDKENRAINTPVTIGQRKNGLIAIESGLNGDERIVVNGLQRVSSQMVITPELVDMREVKKKPPPASIVGGKEAPAKDSKHEK